MSRQPWSSPVLLLLVMTALFLVACDEPNDADIPPQPYRLVGSYSTPSPVLDISVSGNRAAVAVGYLGYDILDVTDPASLIRVDSLRMTGNGAVCQAVAIDASNSLVGSSSTDFGDPNVIYDYLRDARVSGFGATGVSDMNFFARQDTADFWYALSGTDIRISSVQLVRTDTAWYGVPSATWSPSNGSSRMEHFSIRADGILALAYQAGIHFHNVITLESVHDFMAPGIAFDCGWSGDYLIVAAEYYLLIYNVADLHNPALVSQLEIRNADRLQRVAVDGPFAAVMDDSDGIFIVDISNVWAPKVVQSISLIEPTVVEAGDGRFYIGDEVRGMLIYAR